MRSSSIGSLLSCALVVVLCGCGGGGNAGIAPPPPPPAAPVAPSVSLTVQPNDIVSGSAATLIWNSQHAASVSIDQGIGQVASSGSINVTPAVTTDYHATATGSGGKAAASATV